jgi:acetoin utilization deacetylase AcuC-like enzyme
VAERQTGVVYDERCLGHVNPPGGVAPGTLPAWATVEAFERPERLSLTWDVLQGSGALAWLTPIEARHASAEELGLAHTEAHVARVLEAAARPEPVELGGDAWTGPGTHDAMLLAAGGAIAAVAAVLDGAVDNAFALIRPPGHHAETAAAMGFCLFNNAAVAARWAQRERGIERVAIVDWDVHHGNGTEQIFRDDPSVLTISLHQDGLYPADTGGLDGGGVANVNVPLPAGTGDNGYAHAFERVVEPAVREFEPELLLIGAGQDASATDPLGRMSLTVPGFRMLADRAVALAGELCGGRLVAALEGGYSLLHVPLANLAILEGFAGRPASFAGDPVGVDVPAGLRDGERAAVAAAERVHER